MMDENVPEPDDLPPGNSGILPLQFVGNAPGSFPEDLKVVDNPYLDEFVTDKVSFPGAVYFSLSF